ncbi:hypothetical protein IRY61_06440, partial [Candidatus Saccharibacteria bacterium]|nr:hypothetical protein [Candidatus Saccharibacteria bacterium]
MRNLINRTGRIVKRHPVLSLYFMAGAAYLAFTFYYLGGALTSCSTELLSFPGDHTAGLFDYYTVDNVDPWWGYTTFYSYPYGESLWQPYHIVSQVVFVPFWALAKLFGPVCGFNLLAALGFMITSLVTFGFVRWLLGRKELLYAIVAFLAGYAVAFWPYAQHKSGVHIAYVFAGILVASAWLFLKFWQKPRVLWAVLFGLSVAIFGYVDGYFILLGSVLVGGLLVGAYIYELVYKKTSLRDLWPRTKLLLLSGLVAALCLVPVAYVQWRYADQLNSALSSQRDAIGREAQEYGARPYDYLLPNPKHPLIPLFFGEDVRKRLVGINSERNIIGFSKVIAVLAIFMAVVVIYRWRKKQSLVQSALRWDPGFVLMVFGIVVLAAFSLSLA